MTLENIRICDRWDLPLIPGSGGHYQFLNTASRKNNAAFLKLLDGVQANSVLEHFGGVGAFSVIIREMLKPAVHRIWDLNVDCVFQLQSLGFQAAAGDAKLTMGSSKADLVVLDFAVATARTHHEWPWDRVIGTQPRYIIFSDTAKRRIGLHRALYSKWLGEPIVTHEDYVRAYSKFLWIAYGYCVVVECSHVYSYMRAEKRETFQEPEFHRV